MHEFWYLCVSLGCLRSIFIAGPTSKTASKNLEDQLAERVRAAYWRAKSYKVSLYVAVVTTLAFMLALVAHLISHT
jgi:hypothetical protein